MMLMEDWFAELVDVDYGIGHRQHSLVVMAFGQDCAGPLVEGSENTAQY